MMRVLIGTLMLACCCVAGAQEIPSGTVLPIMLNRTLDARHAKVGRKISGRIMQDVPLPSGAKIPKRSTVTGHVVEVERGKASRLRLTFDTVTVHGREVPIATHLRALASANQVNEARMPTNSIDDYGTSPSDWNTVQIGGAGVFRGNGEVVEYGRVVGHATDYGGVTAKLIASPQGGCRASERELALWLFSPSACGVYGYPGLQIVRSADTVTAMIDLESAGDIRVEGGSGWLLRTNGSD